MSLEISEAPKFTVNFADKLQLDPTYRATTLPGLGLIDKVYENNHSGSLSDCEEGNKIP